MIRTVTLALLPLLLGGCSVHRLWYGENKPQISYVELGEQSKSGEGHEKSRVFVWSPQNSAAVVSASKTCIQGAEVFASYGGGVDLSAGSLERLGAVGVNDVQMKADIVTSLATLRHASERNTFLSIGLFGICQLHANGALSAEQVDRLTQALLTSANADSSPRNLAAKVSN